MTRKTEIASVYGAMQVVGPAPSRSGHKYLAISCTHCEAEHEVRLASLRKGDYTCGCGATAAGGKAATDWQPEAPARAMPDNRAEFDSDALAGLTESQQTLTDMLLGVTEVQQFQGQRIKGLADAIAVINAKLDRLLAAAPASLGSPNIPTDLKTDPALLQQISAAAQADYVPTADEQAVADQRVACLLERETKKRPVYPADEARRELLKDVPADRREQVIEANRERCLELAARAPSQEYAKDEAMREELRIGFLLAVAYLQHLEISAPSFERMQQVLKENATIKQAYEQWDNPRFDWGLDD
ncbi:MAG: hypothetical protein ACEQSK_06950 [Sphingomonadaceae bacterium]